jgi:pimeloyl-ACP methyl ester carboxylesterase
LLDNLAGTDTEVFARLLDGLVTASPLWLDLPEVKVPTFFVVGEREDDGEARRHVEQAAATMARARSLVLPGLGHLQAFWRTDLTLGPIASFLDEVLRSGLPASAAATTEAATTEAAAAEPAPP